MNLFDSKDDQMWFFFPNEFQFDGEKYLLRYTDMEKVREINNDELILKHILVDWYGVNDQNGQKAECNDKNKSIFFRTRDGKVRLEWMLKIATDYRAFETDENILKNLRRPFAGDTSIPTPAPNGATNASKVAA